MTGMAFRDDQEEKQTDNIWQIWIVVIRSSSAHSPTTVHLATAITETLTQ